MVVSPSIVGSSPMPLLALEISCIPFVQHCLVSFLLALSHCMIAFQWHCDTLETVYTMLNFFKSLYDLRHILFETPLSPPVLSSLSRMPLALPPWDPASLPVQVRVLGTWGPSCTLQQQARPGMKGHWSQDENRLEGSRDGVCCHLMVSLKKGRPYARKGQSQCKDYCATLWRADKRETRMGKRLTEHWNKGSGQEMAVAWDRR